MKTSPTRNFAEYYWILANHHGFAPSLCITVGTDGGRALTALGGAYPRALHVVVEHAGDDLARARTNLKDMDGRFFHAAALEKPGSIAVPGDRPNLLKATVSAGSPDGDGSLEAVTLDGIVDTLDVKGPSLLKLDCRGAELRTLAGATETLLSCDVAVIKVALHKLWGDTHPEFAEIVRFMREQGFVVHDFLNGLFRPADRALGVIDVAFVRQDGMMYGNRNWFK